MQQARGQPPISNLMWGGWGQERPGGGLANRIQPSRGHPGIQGTAIHDQARHQGPGYSQPRASPPVSDVGGRSHEQPVLCHGRRIAKEEPVGYVIALAFLLNPSRWVAMGWQFVDLWVAS